MSLFARREKCSREFLMFAGVETFSAAGASVGSSGLTNGKLWNYEQAGKV
jgi:hypothetical protein